MYSSRCAACKHLRRRCPSNYIFSPYFPSNNPRRFAYVHKIYGASNVKLRSPKCWLSTSDTGHIFSQPDLPVYHRVETANSLYYEANRRMKDPVYGCVGMISILHQQIHNAQCQLARVQAEKATLITHSEAQQYELCHQHIDQNTNAPISISTSFFDISTLVD